MNTFALKTFFRSLARHKLHAGLNIGGLAVGIAVFLVLGMYVRFETGYERWLPDYQRVYLVEAQLQSSINDRPSQNTPVALWSDAHRDLPGIVGTRVKATNASVLKDGIGVKERLALVDADFAQVFALPTLQGSLISALRAPSSIVLTQSTAAKYFGASDPVGKTMTVTYEGASHAYRVAAVVRDLPHDTDLSFGMIARLVVSDDRTTSNYAETHQWNYFQTSTYIQASGRDASKRLADQLTAVASRHAQSETPDETNFSIKLSLQPLADVHFETAGEKQAVTTLGVVGLLTLLIAIMNYVNLATARAGLRAREVAMRKVLGASRLALTRQYIGEAVTTSAIAGVFGLAFAEIGLPLVNAAGGLALSISYFGWDGVLLPLIALISVVGLAAGIYPALVLSRFPAAAVLASAQSPGGGRWGTRVREILVVAQFAIAITFMVCTGVFVTQIMHVRAADLGYDRQNMLLVRSFGSTSLNTAQRDTLLHRFAAIPGVKGVTIGNNVPGGGMFGAQTNIAIPGDPRQGPSMQFFEVSPRYFETLGAHLLAGRYFDPSRPGDVNANLSVKSGGGSEPANIATSSVPANIIVNRSGATALHFANPQAAIGKTVGGATPRTIIGVIEDMRFDTPRMPVPPTLYDFQLRDMSLPIAVVRFTGNPKSIQDAVQQAWRQEAPEVPFDARTAVQALDTFYQQDDHAARLFTIGAALAVLIGCVGLWGLASFNTTRRVKEIGIRKVLGASSADVVTLLVAQFLRPVFVANLFAWPLAWFAMRAWLAGFNDRIDLSPLFFVVATLSALLIAVLTVLAQSLRAARSAPAWALRHD